MRTTILLVSAAFALTACSDTADTTAPRGKLNRTSDGSAARVADFPPGPTKAAAMFPPGPGMPAAQVADYPPGPGAAAKPSTGFTTVTIVESATAVFAGLGNVTGFPSSGTLNANCPVGSQVVGGGYEITSGPAGDLVVEASRPNATNGWKLKVFEAGNGSSYVYVRVAATCVQ